MGIDFLDMTFRLEKRFNIRIENGEWSLHFQARPNLDPRKMTAGDVSDFIEQRFRTVDAKRPGEWHGTPLAEGRPLLNYEGLPPPGVELDAWPEVRLILSEMLNLRIEKINRESRLIKDLGMS